jgi:hypothetical protein
MNEEIPLATLQKRFKQVLSEESVQVDPSWIGLRQTPPLSVEQRLRIYCEDYWYRLHESLEEDFPRVVKWVGKKNFPALVRAFVRASPSQYANVGEISSQFPAYLASKRDGQRLSELARFEWAILQSRGAPTGPQLNIEKLQTLPPECLPGVILELHPSVILLESLFPVDRMGKRTKVPTVSASPTRLLIFRYQEGVIWRRVPGLSWEILKQMANAVPLAQLGLGLSQKISDDQVFTWFSAWAAEGVVAGFRQNK